MQLKRTALGALWKQMDWTVRYQAEKEWWLPIDCRSISPRQLPDVCWKWSQTSTTRIIVPLEYTALDAFLCFMFVLWLFYQCFKSIYYDDCGDRLCSFVCFS
jgi:hypothetical protein